MQAQRIKPILILALKIRKMRLLNMKPMSEMFTIPSLTHSSRVIEKLGRWLVIMLGMSFLVQGLGRTLPDDISSRIAVSLLALVGLMIIAMIWITIANWKIK